MWHWSHGRNSALLLRAISGLYSPESVNKVYLKKGLYSPKNDEVQLSSTSQARQWFWAASQSSVIWYVQAGPQFVRIQNISRSLHRTSEPNTFDTPVLDWEKLSNFLVVSQPWRRHLRGIIGVAGEKGTSSVPWFSLIRLVSQSAYYFPLALDDLFRK